MKFFTVALNKVTRQESLNANEAYAAFSEIFACDILEVQVAAFLGALRGKGETAEEILGCVRFLREKGVAVLTRHKFVVDTCGTGGDASQTFNISTASAFVAAGAGVVVAKHGNRSVSSRCGSADVLEALGIPTDVEPALAEKALTDLGITFLFAPKYHPILKKLSGLRRSLGFKTIFNIAGPLSSPVRSASRGQVVGVFEKRLVPIVAEVLKALGAERAWVVHSRDGLDEISTSDATNVAKLEKGKVTLEEITPEDAGMRRGSLAALRGSGAEENARIILDILDGKAGAPRDAVLLNAAAACIVGGKTSSLKSGFELARKSIDSGKAKQIYLELKNFIAKNVELKVL